MPTENIIPTDQDVHIARNSWATLDRLATQEGVAQLRFGSNAKPEADLVLPTSVVKLLSHVLKEIGKGNGIAITPIHKEYTTQEAADFLIVSRPYLIEELLEKGHIPYRKVGNRRRIRYADLLSYKNAEDIEIARREKVMLELIEETAHLGLYK